VADGESHVDDAHLKEAAAGFGRLPERLPSSRYPSAAIAANNPALSPK